VSVATPESKTAGLVRDVRRWDLVALMINSIIGTGIFGLPSQAYALIGAYSIFAFAACAVVAALVAICYAEVASRFSASGGPFLYAYDAFGPLAAFQVGWLALLARVSSIAVGCNVLVSYTAYFFPAATSGAYRIAVMGVVVGLITIANIVGVSRGAIVSDFLTIGKLLPIALFIAAGLFFLNPHGFALSARPSVTSFSLVVSQLIFAFTGFEIASMSAGETRDPQRNMPFAILTAICVVVVLYMLIQIVCIGTVPNLASTQKPLADGSRIFLGRAGASIITAGVIVSAIGILSANILSGSRLPFAMAECGQLPRIVAAIHPRFRTPYTAILATAGLGLALGWTGTFRYTLSLSSIAKLTTFIASCAAMFVSRRRRNAPPAYFHAPAGSFLSVVAIALCLWLVANSGWREIRDVCIAASLGFIVYFASKFEDRAHSPLEGNSAGRRS
jgi:basic amino acid/polyamine antiporter, APA family